MATLKEQIADLKAEIEALEEQEVVAVEAHCAHIPIDWVEVGGVRVGLDACGTAVRVELPDSLYGWLWE